MDTDALKIALSAARSALTNALGPGLQSLYLYGSVAEGYFHAGSSDVNLLVIVDSAVSLTDVREALLPVYTEHGALLRTGPAVANAATLSRQRRYNSNWLHLVGRRGRLLAGAPLLLDAPPFDAVAALADACFEAMTVSALLAPTMLPKEIQADLLRRLQRLARRLHRRRIRLDAPPAALLSSIFGGLSDAIADLPDAGWSAAPLDDAPPHLPQLRAIYERADELILVLPKPLQTVIQNTDWPSLAAEGARDYGSLHITTGAQLRLVGALAAPLSVALGHYSHAWGREPLADVTPTPADIRHAAGRLASDLLLIDLPGEYIAATDAEALHKTVHDIQNRLLNLQLQHELLHRLFGFPAGKPPGPLPGREAPLPERIQSIVDQLDWWARHYDAPAPAA